MTKRRGPKPLPPSQRRNCSVRVLCTEKQLEIIKQRAAMASKSVSTYMLEAGIPHTQVLP